MVEFALEKENVRSPPVNIQRTTATRENERKKLIFFFHFFFLNRLGFNSSLFIHCMQLTHNLLVACTYICLCVCVFFLIPFRFACLFGWSTANLVVNRHAIRLGPKKNNNEVYALVATRNCYLARFLHVCHCRCRSRYYHHCCYCFVTLCPEQMCAQSITKEDETKRREKKLFKKKHKQRPKCRAQCSRITIVYTQNLVRSRERESKMNAFLPLCHFIRLAYARISIRIEQNFSSTMEFLCPSFFSSFSLLLHSEMWNSLRKNSKLE